jgi:FimV-like protein
VENAFTDNIEVNKQKRSTGLLQSIVSAVKENPLFERSTIDSSKLAEKPLASVNTEQKLNNKETLEDLLNQDDKQNQQNKNASNNNSAQIDDMDKNLSAHNQNNKITRTDTKITDSKLDQQDSNLLIEEQKRQNNKALYKKYGLQLVLSFLMVLISGVFVVKLLRRSNSSTITEEFQEPLTIANNKIANENLTEKGIDSIHNDYVSGTKLTSSGATDFANIDDELASLDFDEHSDTNVDELAEIEAAISDIKKEEGIQDYKPSKPAISKKIMDIPTKSSHMPIENTDFDIETIELSEHMTNETLTLNGGNMEELLPDELQESFDLLADNKKEVNLKIDLAKQYVEAGDATSAKSILNEIIDIAEPEQKHEIENILKGLVSSKA